MRGAALVTSVAPLASMQIAAPHARLAFLRGDLIVFDLRDDRYIALPGAVIADDSRTFAVPLTTCLDPGAAMALSEAGLLINGIDNKQSYLLPPASTLPPAVRCSVRLRDIAYLVIALARAGWRLSRGRHCSTFHMDRLSPLQSVEEGVYADAIARLAALRLLIPTPQRCLPAALVAGIALKMQGLDAEIVFGVRGHPFEAHCWLQRGNQIIDDDLDRVISYTPIAVGQL